MGIINSRRSASVEEADNVSGNMYRYPPKSGCYFGSYFIMGGERFDTNQQDTYLFGENEDLNFLGSKPVPFPYPAPLPHEPTKTLKSLVNIRRDSLKFVKETPDDVGRVKPDGELAPTYYNVEFTFDSDVKCAITIYYFATEEITNKQAIYHPRDALMNSETFHYKRGANQVFSQSTHVLDPAQFSEDDWQYSIDKEVVPVVIQCVVEEEEFLGHSHSTFAIVDKSCDGGYVLKCLKQKQMIDGVCYLLQEVYGIENKNVERAKQEDEIEDNGSECVICMCETRDTLILPCRHLCLCNSCADNLRYQANNCPICRAKFSALLQIRAMRRRIPTVGIGVGSLPSSLLSNRPLDSVDETALCQEGVPPGYEAISLIEALNGPTLPQCALSATVLPTDITVQSLSSTESSREAASGRFESSHTSNGDVKRRLSCAELSVVSEIELASSGFDETTADKNSIRNDLASQTDVGLKNIKTNPEPDIVLNIEEKTEKVEAVCIPVDSGPEDGCFMVSGLPNTRSASCNSESSESMPCINQPDEAVLKAGGGGGGAVGDVTRHGDSASSGLLLGDADQRQQRRRSAMALSSQESSCTTSSKDLFDSNVDTTD